MHVILSLQDHVHINIGTAQSGNSKRHKQNSQLTFEDHINCICKKASAKLNALSRISNCECFLHPSLINVLLPGYFRVKNQIMRQIG